MTLIMKSGARVLTCALVLGAPACFATTSDPEYVRDRRHGSERGYYERERDEHHHGGVERAPDAYPRDRERRSYRESAPPARESAPPARRLD
jgi:hypothetical protein